ncbi:DNA primase [Pseudonocardia sp. Ae168_Ps1]|uniref:DNA primase n=1 Tax=unclassified Pseudonocardia TaxID=2619320 RepID=UPI00094B3D32|nr:MULTISPECIES: DNA primase [unclassified Pseudonocardia]OLL73124.1 DNA primase [Pseudonocardia sp. Ae150A_Ps1]OLL79101.1 DNA primase [Pseudonocardia sp. Ae168_Ps1]OLL86762.1 DNA primase [Pseudonocardia sp. Ae263_Ps1]OLL93194.1 DNA primase [Pseudonocardia sp. Ae356_Ps1]
MAGRIRDADITEVRNRVRVEEIVEEYVALRRAGAGSLKGLCPFHDEKTPSFNVRPSHGTFHCFGCGEHGSVIDFVMKMEVIGFPEAVERLADRCGVRLTYEGGGSSVQRDRGTRSRLLEINRKAAEFYAEQLRTPAGRAAMQFLSERGFDQAAAEKFGCGYAPAGWDTVTKHLLGQGYQLDELIKSGIAKEGRRGAIDRFHRRLLWPIRDLGGDVVGFGARRLFDDDGIEAKYLNTSETPVYRKTHVLFGLDQAKREIAKSRQVVVVEGYTDVMAMHLAGVPTAVASCGTAFGSEHISVIRRLIGDDSFDRGEVIFTFDGDDAGQKAAQKAFEGDQSFATQTYVAIAADGQDPCELRHNHGDAAVKDLVARREPLFEFAIRTELRNHRLETAEGRVAALQQTVPIVAKIKREDLRDEYARRLAGWVGWDDIAVVVRRVRETAGGPAEGRSRRRAPLPAPKRDDTQLHLQREALKAALQIPGVVGPGFDELPEAGFTHPQFAAVQRAILGAGGVGAGLEGPEWLDAVVAEIATDDVKRLVSELAVEGLELPKRNTDELRYVNGVLAGVRLGLVEREIADLKSQLQRTNSETDHDEYMDLFGVLVPLEQYKIQLREQAAGVAS